jgi:hypothetical protein
MPVGGAQPRSAEHRALRSSKGAVENKLAFERIECSCEQPAMRQHKIDSRKTLT